MSDVENVGYTTQDIVNHALSKDAVNLATAFNGVIGKKVVDSIAQRKIEIAQRMMNPQAEVEQDMSSAEDEVADSLDAEQQDVAPESNEEQPDVTTASAEEEDHEEAQQDN